MCKGYRRMTLKGFGLFQLNTNLTTYRLVSLLLVMLSLGLTACGGGGGGGGGNNIQSMPASASFTKAKAEFKQHEVSDL